MLLSSVQFLYMEDNMCYGVSNSYGSNSGYGLSLSQNSNTYDGLTKATSSVGQNMAAAESELMAAAQSGDQGKVTEAQLKYQKWQQIFQTLSTILNNKYQNAMTVIRNMSVR